MKEVFHQPVLTEEAIFYLNCEPGKVYVDGTIGGGGHASAILERTAPNGFLLGIDWDMEAIKQSERKLRSYQGRYRLLHENFAHLTHVLEASPWKKVDGILLDLGISFHHLNEPQRGFSFLKEGPLDMRMNRQSRLTAGEIVNRFLQRELTEIIHEYGEERWAARIAKHIVKARKKMFIETTLQLSKIVAEAIPKRYWPRRIHPATRTFQALRIAVNREIENLENFLKHAIDLLKPKGRLVIISFHSLEDRLVKRYFRNWAKERLIKLLTKRPIVPTVQEIKKNPHARSAKLRAVEKEG
ncbi:MAG: hypothetical protein AMJ45_02705 [Syntrophobacter sp. DG_60]|nr:MAG: hypothetical protein AMJ45_02705 [Syntrophobacter sp. DG_60]